MSFFFRILNFVFPQACRVCNLLLSESHHICENCLSQIKWIRGALCLVCGTPFESQETLSHPCAECLKKPPSFTSHRSLVYYSDPVRQLIHRYKFKSQLDLIPLFCSWILQEQKALLEKIDYLIPVPLSRIRLKKRTYNQSLELARTLSQISGIPFLVHSLIKIQETPPQTGLSRTERIRNLKGAFLWRDEKVDIKDKNILLIDDVFTTGSTLATCASVLKIFKPHEIHGLTLAFNKKG